MRSLSVSGASLASGAAFLLLAASPLHAQHEPAAPGPPDVHAEVVEVAREWMRGWNERDLDLMERLHDEDLLYYWRGGPRGYDEFMEELRLYVFPEEDGEVVLMDPRVQVLSPDAAVVGFQLRGVEEPGEEPTAAATLVVVRRASGWKVLHIHESPVRE